jgi:hypothetical protein
MDQKVLPGPAHSRMKTDHAALVEVLTGIR